MFIVKNIISGDEILVEPKWQWKGFEGNTVIVFGYETPRSGMYGFEFAKKKLKALIEGKNIELYSPQFYDAFGTAKLVCRVYLDGIDIANYFPEFKNRQPGFQG